MQKWAIFQLYQDEREQVTFNEMIMTSALYLIKMLNGILIVLVYWNNSSGIDMLYL